MTNLIVMSAAEELAHHREELEIKIYRLYGSTFPKRGSELERQIRYHRERIRELEGR